MRLVDAAPAFDLDPFALLKIFVVLKKVLNGIQTHGVDVRGLLPVAVNRQDFVLRNRQ